MFERTVAWIEAARLECATFHILTPYPGTPLFRQMEAEGRLLHRDWSLYDTAHVVFRPRHMTPEELAEGYAWCYERLFSHGSIWRRRPEDWRAVPPYLAMSYLYKRSNRLWHLLIRHRLTGPVWRPLVEWTRRRHLRVPAAAGARDRPRRPPDGGRGGVRRGLNRAIGACHPRPATSPSVAERTMSKDRSPDDGCSSSRYDRSEQW